MVISASMLVGFVISFPVGLATFFSLRYIGLKINQIIKLRT